MAWGMCELRFPAQSPAAYLSWASWWHSLDRHLARLSAEDGAPVDLSILDRSEVWDRLLDLVSQQASRAMLTHDRSLEPMLRASRQDFADAARVLRSRLTWLSRAADDDLPRPDARVSRISGALLGAVDEAAAGTMSRHSVA
jgi:hypothetical protein